MRNLYQKVGNVQYYLLDNPYYFMRDGMYGFYDDCERFVFFSRAVLEILPVIGFHPDIIHCNDWQTAMIPVFYRVLYQYHQEFANIRTVYTIHNIQYQGIYGKEVVSELMGLPTYHINLLEYDGSINLMKGAIETADQISTVSPSYAKEILDPWYSYGMDRALVRHQDSIAGILNGIDVKSYNPKPIPIWKPIILFPRSAIRKLAAKLCCKKCSCSQWMARNWHCHTFCWT